jgi:ubiquinone/menaquinone biosynthesis C-methylase UbiE
MPQTTEFKDLFSRQSTDYAKFRPHYPDTLFQYLASLTNDHSTAWDCGTGNGQAAVKLAEHFQRVIATDPSAKQISSATPHSKVEYRVGSAEKTTFDNHSIDLITVAQAFHWFKHDDFFAEAERILRPKGVLAFWCYELCTITPEIDAVVMKLYQGVLGSYWEPERKLVEAGYKSIQMPMQEITPPAFEMKAEWNLEHLVGYLSTWSALQTYIQKNQSNPLEASFNDLKNAWGDVGLRPVRWELALRVGRNN